MKPIRLSLLVVLLMLTFRVSASSMIDLVMLEFFEKNIPAVVFNQADIPWDYGTYSIKVTKNGKSSLKGAKTLIKAELPVKVNLKARVLQNIGFAKINVNCTANFVTRGLVELKPDRRKMYKQASARVNIPVPEVYMDCDGIKFPVSNTLRKLIADNKPKWEEKITDEYRKLWVN